MKKLCALLILSMILTLAACGGPAAEESAPFEQETSVPAAAEETVPPPALSAGASSYSRRADRFGTAADGSLITSLIRADGITCVYDLLPGDIGYVASFIAAEDGIYAAVKEQYLTLDPAALYFFPRDGEPQLLADGISPDGVFVMTENTIFFADAEENALHAWPESETQAAPAGEVRLLDAGDGFIYYEKENGVWRNDSTMTAEASLFPTASGSVREEDGYLYTVAFAGDTAVIERYDTAGNLLATFPLPGLTDNFIVSGGRLYIPFPSLQRVEVRSCDTGELLETTALPEGCGHCLMLCADDDAFYFETVLEGGFTVCRGAGGTAEALGPELLF